MPEVHKVSLASIRPRARLETDLARLSPLPSSTPPHGAPTPADPAGSRCARRPGSQRTCQLCRTEYESIHCLGETFVIVGICNGGGLGLLLLGRGAPRGPSGAS